MADPHVVLVGGGFAGLNAAKALTGKPVRVTLVDRANHHTFQPLLYQVATTALSPGQIATPLRQILRRAGNVSVVLDEALGFDLDARKVTLRHAELAYDFLLVASGARHSYFGHGEWEPLAPGLKTIEDALEIRRRVLSAFEEAERRGLTGEATVAPTFVVIGAGPTGMELAGALADIATRVLAGNFRAIDPAASRIILLDAARRVLPTFPEELSAKAAQQLADLGIEARTGCLVTAVEAGRVLLEGGEEVAADVVLWATGVAASPLGKALGVETDRAGRVMVAPDLSLPGRPEVFVAGDLARCLEADGRPLPGVAPVAMQQGTHAAKCILADLAGKPRAPFRYRDRGTMATIGRRRAVADLGRLKLSGFPAWLAWLFLHVLFLVGFKNRVGVLAEWIWAYFTPWRAARLITGAWREPR